MRPRGGLVCARFIQSAPLQRKVHRGGRQIVLGQPAVTPVAIVIRQDAADILHIPGVTVVGKPRPDHRFQRRRTKHGDLRGVIAALGNAKADHRDLNRTGFARGFTSMGKSGRI